MEYSEYIVAQGNILNPDGRKVTVNIVLPCFTGEGSEFYAAARLNEFYAYAAGMLYSSAASICDVEARQIGYVCRSEVKLDGDAAEVSLYLTVRRTYRGRQSAVSRKVIIHTFRNGYAVRRKVVSA